MITWKEKFKLRLPALILLLSTILFWTLYDRYEPAGPILLATPKLADGTKIRGEVSANNGHFILAVPPGGKSARVNFQIPAATEYEQIRVRARIKVEGVVVGKYPWSCARLVVAQYDAKNKWISGHHGLVMEKGSKGWGKHEDVFEIFPGTDRADVVLQQAGTAGVAEFDGIEAQPVRIRASFIWWRLVFTGQWLLAAGLYFPRCRLHRRRLKGLIILNIVAILAGTLMPSEWIRSGSARFKNAVEELRAPDPVPDKLSPTEKRVAPKPNPLHKEIDWFMDVELEAHEMGHFVLFASLCFLVYLSAALERQHPAYFFKVGFDILLFAAITEALQFLTFDRTAGILDLRTDVYGMATALFLFILVRPLLPKKPLAD